MSSDSPTRGNGAAEDATRRLDVREIDGEPFTDIMAALDALGPEDALVLVNSFEPRPLYAVLARRGFDYETDRVGDDEWRVRITRT
ncbi:DUF2249 domain-containing protein [Halegenticoccus soli]|uniref:DUF2249 domain-containing protein n=1 Tax=Halegenticoccus soli TaxID=1985678 RepID=UPI000C6CF4E4|nr:DUF2249 domain-containing protein [Halegenticoccus soli]